MRIVAFMLSVCFLSGTRVWISDASLHILFYFVNAFLDLYSTVFFLYETSFVCT